MSNRRNSCWRAIANQFDSSNPPPPGVADDFLTPPLPFSPPPRPPPLPPNSPPLRASSPSSSSSKTFMSLSTCSDHAKKSGVGTATTTTATSTSPTNSKWCFYNGVIYDYPLANPPASIYQFSNYWYHQTPIVYQPAYVSVSRNVQMDQRKVQSSCSRRPRRYYRDYSKKSTEHYRSFRHRLRSSSPDREKDDKYHQTTTTKGKSKRSYYSTADRSKSSESMSSKKLSEKSKEETELATSSRTSEAKKSSSSKRDLRESSVSSKSSSGSSENSSHIKSITGSNNSEKNSSISSKYEKSSDASTQKSRSENKCSVETEREIAAKFQTKLPFSNKKIKFYLNSSHPSEKSKDLDSKDPVRESKLEKTSTKSNSEKSSSSLSGKSHGLKATENKNPTEIKKTPSPNTSKTVTKPKEIKSNEECKPKPTTMLLEKLKAIQMEASKSHSHKEESKPTITKTDNVLHEKSNNPQSSTLPENTIEDKWTRAFGSNSFRLTSSSKKSETEKKMLSQINQKTQTTNVIEDKKKPSLSDAIKCQFKDENLKIILKRVPEVWNMNIKKKEIPLKNSCPSRSILKPKPEIVDEDSEDVVPLVGSGFKRYRILSSDSEIEDDPTTWKDLKPFNSQAQKRCRSRILRRRPKTLSETSSDSSPERKKATSPTRKLSQSIIETVSLSEISSSSSDTGSENSPPSSVSEDKQLPIKNTTAANFSQLSNVIQTEMPVPIKNQVKKFENPIVLDSIKTKQINVKKLEDPIVLDSIKTKQINVKKLENPIVLDSIKTKQINVKKLEDPIVLDSIKTKQINVKKLEDPIVLDSNKTKQINVKKLEDPIVLDSNKTKQINITKLEDPIVLDSIKTKQVNVNYEPEEGEIIDDEDVSDLWNNVVFDNKLINEPPVVDNTMALENKSTSNPTTSELEIGQSEDINPYIIAEKQQNKTADKTFVNKNQPNNSSLFDALQSNSEGSGNVSWKMSVSENSFKKTAPFQYTRCKNDEKEVEEIRYDANEDMDVDVETVMNDENLLKNDTEDDLQQIVQVISLDNSLGEQACSNVGQEVVIDQEGCTIMQIMEETIIENAMILHLEDQLMEENKSEIFNEFLDFINEKQNEEKKKKYETTQTVRPPFCTKITLDHATSPDKSHDIAAEFLPENQDVPLLTSEMFQALPQVIMQNMSSSVSQTIAQKISDTTINLVNAQETPNLTHLVTAQKAFNSTHSIIAQKTSNSSPPIIQLEIPEPTPEVITQELVQVVAQEANEIVIQEPPQAIVQKTPAAIAHKTVQLVGQKRSYAIGQQTSPLTGQKKSQVIVTPQVTGMPQVTEQETFKVTARETSPMTAQKKSKVAAQKMSQVTAQETSQVIAQKTFEVAAQKTSQVTTLDKSQEFVRETSQLPAKEIPQIAVQKIPKVVPQETPQMSAQKVQKVVPQETPQMSAQKVHKAVDQETPQVTAQKVHKVVAQETPQVTAQNVHKAVDQKTPQVTAQKVHKVVAQETPQVTAQKVPKVVAQKPSQMIVQETPQVVVQQIPQVDVQRTPQVDAQRTPQVDAQRTPQVDAQQTPQVDAQRTPQVDAQRTPQVNVKQTPQMPVLKNPQVIAQEASQIIAQETYQVIAQESLQVTPEKTLQVIAQETHQEVIAKEPNQEIIAQEPNEEIIARETYQKIIAQNTFQKIQQIITPETPKIIAQEMSQVVAQETSKVIVQESHQPIIQEFPQVIASKLPPEIPSKLFVVTSQINLQDSSLPFQESIPAPVQHSIPVSMQQSIPVSTPHSIPVSTPHSISVSTQQFIPVEMPQSIPVATQQSIPMPIQQCFPVSTQQTIPVSTQQSIPVSTQHNIMFPISTQQSIPVSTQQITPVSTQQSIPVSIQQMIPVSTQQSIPVSTQQMIPVSSQQMIPVSTQQMISITPQKLDSVILHNSLQEASTGKIQNNPQNILLLITPETYKEKILKTTQETTFANINSAQKSIEIKPTQIHHQLPPQVLAPIKTQSPTQLRVQLPPKVRQQLQSQVNFQSSPQMRQPSALKLPLSSQETNKDVVQTLPQTNSQATFQTKSCSLKTQIKPYLTSEIMTLYGDSKVYINETGMIKPTVTFSNTTSVENNQWQSSDTKLYVPENNEGNRPTLRSITRAAKRRGAPINNLLEVQFDNPHPLEYKLRNKKYKQRIEEKKLSMVKDSTNNVGTLKKVSEKQLVHQSPEELAIQKSEQLAAFQLKNKKKVEELVAKEISMSKSIAQIKGSKENKLQSHQIKEPEINSSKENSFHKVVNSTATINNKNKQQIQIATKSVTTENNNHTTPISTNCTTAVNNNSVQFPITTSNNFNSIEIATTLTTSAEAKASIKIATTSTTADINNSVFVANKPMEIAGNKTLKQLLTNTATTDTNNISVRNENSLANKNNESFNQFNQVLSNDSQAQIISVDKNKASVNDQSNDSTAIIKQTCTEEKTKEGTSTNVKPVQLPTLPIDIVSTLKKIENRIEETKNTEHCDSDQEVLILKVCMANKNEQNQMETNQNKQTSESNIFHLRPFVTQSSQRYVATVTSSSKAVHETLTNSITSHAINLMPPISPPQPRITSTLKPQTTNIHTTASSYNLANILTTSSANNRNQIQLPISHSLPISLAPTVSIGTPPHIITQRVSTESDMILNKIKEVQNSMVSKPQMIPTSSPCFSSCQLSPKVTLNRSPPTSISTSLTTPVHTAASYMASQTMVTPSIYTTATSTAPQTKTKKRLQSEASQMQAINSMHTQISNQTSKTLNGRVGEHLQSKQQMSTLMMNVQSTPAVSAAAASQLHYQTNQTPPKPPQLLKVANPAPSNPLPWPQKFNDNPRAILNFLETNRQRMYVPTHQNLIPAHTTVNNQGKPTPNSSTLLVPSTVNLTKSTSIVPPVAHSTNKSILTKDTVSVEPNIVEKSNQNNQQNRKSENITLQYSPLYLSCQQAPGANSGILCQLLKYNIDPNKSINQNASAEKISAEGINNLAQQQLINKLNLGLNRPLFHVPASKKMPNSNDPSSIQLLNPAWQSMREYEKYFDIEHLNLYRRKQESMKLNQQRLQLVQQPIDSSSPNTLMNNNNLTFGINTSREKMSVDESSYKPSFRPIKAPTAKEVQNQGVQNNSPGACAHPLAAGPSFSMIDEQNAIARSWNEFEQHYQKILHQQFAEYQSRMEKVSIDDRSKAYPSGMVQPKAPSMIERQEFQNCVKESGATKKYSFNHPDLINRSAYRGMCGENTCCNSPSNSSIHVPQTQLTSNLTPNASSRMLPIQSSSPIGDRCLQDPKSIFVINGSKKCSEVAAADNRSFQSSTAASTANAMSPRTQQQQQQHLPIRLPPNLDPEQIRRYNAVNMKHKDNEAKKANTLSNELEDQALQARNLNFPTYDNHGLHSPSSYHNMPLNVPNNLLQKGNVVMPVPYRPIPVMQSNYDLPPLLPSNAMDQWAVNKNHEVMMKDMPPARVIENPNEHCPYEHMASPYLSVPLMYPHLWNRYN